MWISIYSFLFRIIGFKFSEVLISTFTVDCSIHITRTAHQLREKTFSKVYVIYICLPGKYKIRRNESTVSIDWLQNYNLQSIYHYF